MKLLTKEIIKKLPAFYTNEEIPLKDQIAVVKFFCPWNHWTWYATEGQEEDGDFIFFGYVVGDYPEPGYFSLRELESITGPAGLRIERDLHFKAKPLSECKGVELYAD